MQLKFIVIDDERSQVALILDLLRRLKFKNIWPEGPDNVVVFSDWSKVWNQVFRLRKEGWDPSADCCVLILDLALTSDYISYAEGLEELQKHAQNTLTEYVVVVLTRAYDEVEDRLKSVVDFIGASPHLFQGHQDSRLAALESFITQALRRWQERTKRTPPEISPTINFTVEDSPAARRIEAALGRNTLRQIARDVGADWPAVRIVAMSGGYSGAYLLRLVDEQNSDARQVVCKVASEQRLLDEELTAWKKAIARYRSFAGLIPPYQETIVKPIGRSAYYLVQAHISGSTMETALLALQEQCIASGPADLTEPFGKHFASLEKALLASISDPPELESLTDHLQLKQDDCDRFDDSVITLTSIGRECARRGYLPHDYSDEAGINDLKKVAAGWTQACDAAGLGGVPVCDQHGDLNPRNIMIADNGTLQLVDFARFGRWPIPYDFVRLELQLLLRLVDRFALADNFPNGLNDWWLLWRQIMDEPSASGKPATPMTGATSVYTWVIERIRRTYASLDRKLEKVVPHDQGRKIRNLLRCYDAIKMCSYQDASIFKRLWFLLIAVNTAQAAGLRLS